MYRKIFLKTHTSGIKKRFEKNLPELDTLLERNKKVLGERGSGNLVGVWVIAHNQGLCNKSSHCRV